MRPDAPITSCLSLYSFSQRQPAAAPPRKPHSGCHNACPGRFDAAATTSCLSLYSFSHHQTPANTSQRSPETSGMTREYVPGHLQHLCPLGSTSALHPLLDRSHLLITQHINLTRLRLRPTGHVVPQYPTWYSQLCVLGSPRQNVAAPRPFCFSAEGIESARATAMAVFPGSNPGI